jgi:hypothetical protein
VPKYTINELMERQDIPRAHGFLVAYCADPNCGPHIIALDADEEPMCEMVIAPRSVPKMVMAMSECLTKPMGRN